MWDHLGAINVNDIAVEVNLNKKCIDIHLNKSKPKKSMFLTMGNHINIILHNSKCNYIDKSPYI